MKTAETLAVIGVVMIVLGFAAAARGDESSKPEAFRFEMRDNGQTALFGVDAQVAGSIIAETLRRDPRATRWQRFKAHFSRNSERYTWGGIGAAVVGGATAIIMHNSGSRSPRNATDNSNFQLRDTASGARGEQSGNNNVQEITIINNYYGEP